MRISARHLIAAVATAAMTAGCSSGRVTADEETVPDKINLDEMKQKPILSYGLPAATAKTILYKTSGDFRDNVPVQVNSDGTLASYPSPSDIPEDAAPKELKSGWLLSPVGVGPQTAFTTYTYEEYRKLEEAPSPEEILRSVIPGSKVTIAIEAPIPLSEALANPDSVDRYLSPTPKQ